MLFAILGAAFIGLAGCSSRLLILRERIHRRFDGYSIVVSNLERRTSKLGPEKNGNNWVAGVMFPSHDRGKEVVRGDTFSLADVNFKVKGFLPGIKRNAIILRRRNH